MQHALESLRVLDLSRLLPGPFATQVLADFGADVIKVEEPGRGDYLRGFAPLIDGESAFFLNLNRNKRSLALNLKTEEGRKILLELAEGSDVIVESFRPGVMDRLGLSYPRLRERNPRLIHCAVTGYGQNGPLAQLAGHDVNYLATAGVLAQNRGPDGRPVIPGFQIADVGGGGMNACLGILLALLARERSGTGQMVDAAMVDGVAPWLVYRYSFRGREDTGSGPCLSGEYPCYAVYETADARYVAVGALEPKFWERLCRQLGRPEWIGSQFARGADRDALFRQLRALFRTRSRDQWAEALVGTDCCVTPVLEIEELAAHPHWRARGLVWEVDDPRRGLLQLLGAPVALSETPAGLRSPPPRLGEHTDRVLAELGLSPRQVADLRAKGVAG